MEAFCECMYYVIKDFAWWTIRTVTETIEMFKWWNPDRIWAASDQRLCPLVRS